MRRIFCENPPSLTFVFAKLRRDEPARQSATQLPLMIPFGVQDAKDNDAVARSAIKGLRFQKR